MNTYPIEVHPIGALVGEGGSVQQGTAWAIAGDIVVTAFHVVADPTRSHWIGDGGNATYWLITEDGLIELEPVACDPYADIALLRRRLADTETSPMPWKKLFVCEWGVGQGAAWDAAGFAVVARGYELVLHGTVKKSRPDSSGKAIELFVAEGVDVTWAGASGSPICVDDYVVGILTEEVSGASTLYAADVESALRLLRIHNNADDLRKRCEEVVSRVCSSVESLQALQAKYEQAKCEIAPGSTTGTMEESVHATVERVALFGAEGLLTLLASLDGGDDADVRALKEEIGRCALQAGWEVWRRRLTTRGVDTHGEPSPPKELREAWEDFITRKPWHEQVRAGLQEAASALRTLKAPRDLVAKLKDVNTLGDYGTLRRELAELLRDQTLHDVLERDVAEWTDIKREVLQTALGQRRRAFRVLRYLSDSKTPFGRCFFLTGSTGSGKTYFLEFVLREEIKRYRALVLPISLPDVEQVSEDSVMKAVMKVLHDATGRRFNDLAEFQRMLDDIKSSRQAYLTRLKVPRGVATELPRLVVVVDDLQRAMTSDPAARQLCRILQGIIEQHTIYAAVHWFFTLQDTSYTRLTTPPDPPSFWEVYGGINSFGETLDSDGDRVKVPAKGGWIDLDRINQTEEVGFNVLRDKLGETRFNQALAAAAEYAPDQHAGNLPFLKQPWFAWTLAGLPDESCETAIARANLHYIDLAKRLRNVLLIAADSSDSERDRTNYYVAALAAAFLSGDGRRRRDKVLTEDASQAAPDSATLSFDEQDLLGYIDRLIAGNLLRPIDGPPPYLAIDFEMLWSYESAQRLEAALEDLRVDAAVKELQAKLGHGAPEGLGLKEGTLEFLLMLLDRAPRRKKVEALVKAVLTSGQLPTAAVWFAAPKASPDFQRLLCDTVRDLRKQGRWKLAQQHRPLFAWLTFVERASPAVLQARERLDLLQTDYEAMYQHGLATYYFAVAARILEEATDTDTLRACMLALRGCERAQAGLAEHLADRAVGRLSEISDNVIAEILRYLKDGFDDAVKDRDHRARMNVSRSTANARAADDRRSPKNAQRRWHREFFREWVLHAFCKDLVQTKGPIKTFHFLMDQHWFEEVEMAREANIAIGSYFHHRVHLFRQSNGLGAEFVQLIQKLTTSDRYQDREIASYLIRHTRPTFGESSVRVHRVFHPYLTTLAKDPKLLAERNFRALYEANVGPPPQQALKKRVSMRRTGGQPAGPRRRRP